MAKKSYGIVKDGWKPEMSNEGHCIRMKFTGFNSKGTRVKTTIDLPKGSVPEMIKNIVTLFTADAAVAIRALELVKESAK